MDCNLKDGDKFLGRDDCNKIIDELIAVLSGHGLPVSFAEHLLTEAKNELGLRVTV